MSKADRKTLIEVIILIAAIIAAAFLLGDFLPTVGDAEAPANSYLSTYYIEHTMEDTETPNIVTAILADYRGFDTLFETCVMFLSGVTALMVLYNKEKAPHAERHIARPGSNFSGSILENAFRVIVPIIMIYAFYVLAHGEISLGGGFQAGALLATVFLIDRIIPSRYPPVFSFNGETAAATAGIGVFIYAFTGVLPLFFGGKFLQYEYLPFQWAVKDIVLLHGVGIFMIEAGVTIAVMATIIAILEGVLERTEFDD